MAEIGAGTCPVVWRFGLEVLGVFREGRGGGGGGGGHEICRKAKLYLLKPLQPNAFLTNRVFTENGVQRGDVASQGHTVRLQAELGLESDSAFDAEHLLGHCPASHGPRQLYQCLPWGSLVSALG